MDLVEKVETQVPNLWNSIWAMSGSAAAEASFERDSSLQSAAARV